MTFIFLGGQVTADLGLLPVCTHHCSTPYTADSSDHSLQGFAAHIPDEYLLSLQSLTGDSEGDIISYIGIDIQSCSNS